MIKIGVFGAGHLGRIHINLLNSSNKFKLVGFYDPDKNSINKLNEKNNCKLSKTANGFKNLWWRVITFTT